MIGLLYQQAKIKGSIWVRGPKRKLKISREPLNDLLVWDYQVPLSSKRLLEISTERDPFGSRSPGPHNTDRALVVTYLNHTFSLKN